MAITTDEFVEYDEDNHYYYLTEAGLTKYTGHEELLAVWHNPVERLKSQGSLLHRAYIKSAYNQNKPRYRHRDIVEYRVFLDEHGERNAIIEALTNFIEVTYDSDLDRLILKGEVQFPQSIIDPLIDSGIYYTGFINSYVPEDEYEDGY